MRVMPTQFIVIFFFVNNLEVETSKFLGKSKLNTIMSSAEGLPSMVLTIEPMISKIVLSLTASTMTIERKLWEGQSQKQFRYRDI